MSDEIAFKYLPEKNPKGQTVTGTPLANLTVAWLETIPTWQVKEIEACPFYKDVRSMTTAARAIKSPSITEEPAVATTPVTTAETPPDEESESSQRGGRHRAKKGDK